MFAMSTVYLEALDPSTWLLAKSSFDFLSLDVQYIRYITMGHLNVLLQVLLSTRGLEHSPTMMKILEALRSLPPFD